MHKEGQDYLPQPQFHNGITSNVQYTHTFLPHMFQRPVQSIVQCAYLYVIVDALTYLSQTVDEVVSLFLDCTTLD